VQLHAGLLHRVYAEGLLVTHDAERLIPMTPELVTMLVAAQRRARGGPGPGAVVGALRTRTSSCTASRSRICSPAGRHDRYTGTGDRLAHSQRAR
jgi:hypothetical protein